MSIKIILIINKSDIMANKNVVLDGHSLTDKRVTRDLAEFPYFGILLNFNKATNLRMIIYRTTIKVHKLIDLDVLSKRHVGSNRLEFHFPTSLWIMGLPRKPTEITFASLS